MLANKRCIRHAEPWKAAPWPPCYWAALLTLKPETPSATHLCIVHVSEGLTTQRRCLSRKAPIKVLPASSAKSIPFCSKAQPGAHSLLYCKVSGKLFLIAMGIESERPNVVKRLEGMISSSSMNERQTAKPDAHPRENPKGSAQDEIREAVLLRNKQQPTNPLPLPLKIRKGRQESERWGSRRGGAEVVLKCRGNETVHVMITMIYQSIRLAIPNTIDRLCHGDWPRLAILRPISGARVVTYVHLTHILWHGILFKDPAPPGAAQAT